MSSVRHSTTLTYYTNHRIRATTTVCDVRCMRRKCCRSVLMRGRWTSLAEQAVSGRVARRWPGRPMVLARPSVVLRRSGLLQVRGDGSRTSCWTIARHREVRTSGSRLGPRDRRLEVQHTRAGPSLIRAVSLTGVSVADLTSYNTHYVNQAVWISVENPSLGVDCPRARVFPGRGKLGNALICLVLRVRARESARGPGSGLAGARGGVGNFAGAV